MWQNTAVALAVVGAGAYALWYLLPVALRARLFRSQPALAKAPGCSACSECTGCAPKVDAAQAPLQMSAQSASSDRSHPVRVVRRT